MFTFKQFKIQQEHTAMKVCTDSCIFGALIETNKHTHALDIGAGTGLLSLMQTQKNPNLLIDAVELDPEACKDAQQNFLHSPFQNKPNIHVATIQEFADKTDKKYDLIFSNPPFYENSLLSPSKTKNIAHHTTLLSLEELAIVLEKLLLPTGKTWIILPPVSFHKFIEIARKYGLFCTESTNIHHNIEKPCLRIVGVFEKIQNKHLLHLPIYIRDKTAYSAQFKELLKDFYIIF